MKDFFKINDSCWIRKDSVIATNKVKDNVMGGVEIGVQFCVGKAESFTYYFDTENEINCLVNQFLES